jgi:hypothetical protein
MQPDDGNAGSAAPITENARWRMTPVLPLK